MMPFGNMSPQQILQTAMQQNPNLVNNPNAQNIVQILMSGDRQKGEELARNYCQTYGVTPDQGMQQSRQFFSNMFKGG